MNGVVDGLIGKTTVFDLEPPGFSTEMLAPPGCASKLAGTAAVNCVGLVKVVLRDDPFHCTVAPEIKLEPNTPSVNPGPPAVAEV